MENEKREVSAVKKMDDFLNVAKTNEMLGELLHIKKEEERKNNFVVWGLVVIGAVAVIAGIAYAVHRMMTPDYLDDMEDEFDEDFDDDFFDDEETEE